MKKTVITVLVVIVLVLALMAAGAVGFLWYRDNHVFVDGDAYAIDTKSLDLTGEDISIAYYEELKAKLPDCEITWAVPFQGTRYFNTTNGVTVGVLTLEDVELLATYFPNLETVDASQSTDYDVLEELKMRLPEVEVIYEVTLGGKSFAPDTSELILEVGDYDLETLTANLVHLPSVKTIQLKKPEITLEQVDELRAAYPEIAITCTVEILGQEYDTETTELDLSSLTSDGVAEVVEKLPMLPNLASIDLTGSNEVSTLSKEDAKTLMEAAPEVVFNYSFEFYDEILSTATEEVHIKNKKIGDEGEAEVRLALDLMKNCKRFVLEYCQISYDILAQIRDDYRDQTKVVWRVEFGGGSCYTDVEVIRCTYDLVDDNCANLIYCEDVRFMDIGHNEWLDAVPFVAGMPNLEGIIVSGAPIKDLTPFENCKKLKFLEIGFCEYIEDLTPLASCESLEMLNISNTHALDLKPLDNLPLTHMCARTNPSGVSRVPQEEQDRFIKQHPDCWTTFAGAQPYGVGWRYDEDEITPLPYYALLRKVFRYDDSIIPNNVGWYLSEEIEAIIADLEPAAQLIEEAAPEAVPETTEITQPTTTE